MVIAQYYGEQHSWALETRLRDDVILYKNCIYIISVQVSFCPHFACSFFLLTFLLRNTNGMAKSKKADKNGDSEKSTNSNTFLALYAVHLVFSPCFSLANYSSLISIKAAVERKFRNSNKCIVFEFIPWVASIFCLSVASIQCRTLHRRSPFAYETFVHNRKIKDGAAATLAAFEMLEWNITDIASRKHVYYNWHDTIFITFVASFYRCLVTYSDWFN